MSQEIELDWQPHPIIQGMEVAKYHWYSIIKGNRAFIGARYEVMDEDRIYKCNTMREVFDILSGRR